MPLDAISAWLDATTLRAEIIALRYNIDPRFFLLLYLGSIPPYFASIAWLVNRLRRGQRAVLPAISTLVFFALPALYILGFGKNLPIWVTPAIVALLVAGAFSAQREIRRRVAKAAKVAEINLSEDTNELVPSEQNRIESSPDASAAADERATI